MRSSRFAASLVCITALVATTATQSAAQAASFVYRLGTDTVAIEQFTRTGNKISGEMVQRVPTIVRVSYSVTVGSDGRPTSANLQRMQADGSPVPNAPTNTKFTFTADSAIRENVFPDSVQRRAFAMSKGMVNFPTYVYGPTELLMALKKNGPGPDTVAALGLTGNPGVIGLSKVGGDTLRLRGTAYAVLMRFDANNRLQLIDGLFTTNKARATRGTTSFDIAAVAKAMKPSGVLSVRDVARGSFGPGGMVLIDYGRPLVRERTVWGGALVPFDSVWRAGANDATHLMTTRTLALGTLSLAPGMYTLWVQHTHDGTFLIVNKQTGIWGTQYDATQDIGRVPMQMASTPSHVEEFTIAVKALAANRGAIEMSWGPSMGTVQFTTSVAPAR